MKSAINTPIGRLRFQGPKVHSNVNRHDNRGDLQAELSSRGSKTEANSAWGTTDYVSGSINVHDLDAKKNLKLEFHRRQGSGTLSIRNPGRSGEGTKVSIPVGDVSRTKDNFFSEGFFPESGVSDVRVRVEKDGEEQYTAVAFRHGEDTLKHLYRIEDGIIYEVPFDSGFDGYYEYHGRRVDD